MAQKDPAANDKNPGTEVKPFRTVQAGVDKAKAGDTIYVKEGDYEEMVVINKRPGQPAQAHHSDRMEGRQRADRLSAPAAASGRRVATDSRQQELEGPS